MYFRKMQVSVLCIVGLLFVLCQVDAEKGKLHGKVNAKKAIKHVLKKMHNHVHKKTSHSKSDIKHIVKGNYIY